MDKKSDRLSLHPLSFDDALKALAPPVRKKNERKKVDAKKDEPEPSKKSTK